jgi:4-amino-4-deoxy-L-arabinose transferase-like glycosyltransferase
MAGSQDWTAFFYGSSDPANSITVDKPPMSIWVMALSVRLFGLNSWSILLPQAAMGVLTVYLLYVLVRRWSEGAPALLAAGFMAVTPVSTVMFRYNNPDALLILIMVASALTVAHAIERPRPWLMVMAGGLIGAGFLTKQLQIGLVVPALFLTYVCFANTSRPKRFLHVGYSALSAAAVAGAWLIAVQVTDPAQRPYIGGSRTNSALELTVGYNGLQRLTDEAATRTLAAGSNPDGLTAGYQRFLEPQLLGQFGWFLPLAVVGCAMAIICLAKQEGSRGAKAMMLLCLLWFGTAATVLAYMAGTLHPYYSLTAVPPLCILAAKALFHLLNARSRICKIVLITTLLASATVSYAIALRSTGDFPFLSLVLLGTWALTIAMHLLPHLPRQLGDASRLALLGVLLTGPTLWSINTVINPHAGAGVVAGPAVSGIRSDHPEQRQLGSDVTPGHVALMFGDTPSASIAEVLATVPRSATWVTAALGSETAANYQLALGRAVLPVGGFDGTDPYPTLEKFQSLVAEGEVGSLVVQNLPPLTLEGKGESARIVEWVRENFPAQSSDGTELYLLDKH